jgi:uroporphyrinogen decarboxylase-like protein
MAEMTMRQRMLAYVRGEETDRVPFVQYSGLAGPDEEILRRLGKDNLGVLQWCGLLRMDAPHCRFEQQQAELNGKPGVRRTLHTPVGSLTEWKLAAVVSMASAEHFIKTPADYRALLAYLRDLHVEPDLGPWRRATEALGEQGLPHPSIPRTPFQQLWIEWVSVQDLACHLVDEPGLMEEVFAAMAEVQTRCFEAACSAVREAPVAYIVIPDNVTAPIIGPRYFERFCAPAYRQLADMLATTGRDVPVAVHMDGDLKPLWTPIGDSGLRMLDSMSPPPDNDTSVAQALAMWPEVRVGINFPSSVHLAEPLIIYETTMDIVHQARGTGRLQIQISEDVPPERWRVSFPEIVRAIRDAACE